MKNDVFITGTSCFFPNEPILNEDMEDFLGLIAGKHSRVKPIILKQNGIKQRYYALTKTRNNAYKCGNGNSFHPTAIGTLCHHQSGDRIVNMCNIKSRSDASITCFYGSWIDEKQAIGNFSASGICLSCLQAFKTAFWGY